MSLFNNIKVGAVAGKCNSIENNNVKSNSSKIIKFESKNINSNDVGDKNKENSNNNHNCSSYCESNNCSKQKNTIKSFFHGLILFSVVFSKTLIIFLSVKLLNYLVNRFGNVLVSWAAPSINREIIQPMENILNVFLISLVWLGAAFIFLLIKEYLHKRKVNGDIINHIFWIGVLGLPLIHLILWPYEKLAFFCS